MSKINVKRDINIIARDSFKLIKKIAWVDSSCGVTEIAVTLTDERCIEEVDLVKDKRLKMFFFVGGTNISNILYMMSCNFSKKNCMYLIVISSHTYLYLFGGMVVMVTLDAPQM